jgi:hypothetical protein
VFVYELNVAPHEFWIENGRGWVSSIFIDQLNKEFRVSIPEFPTTVVGARTSLGPAAELQAVLARVGQKKRYSRKTAIGVATAVGVAAALGSFAVGWTRRPGPSRILYPGP